MAQQTLIPNNDPLGSPNTGTGTDQGDSWNGFITKLTTMYNDLYGLFKAGLSAVTFRGEGTLSANVTQIGSSATNTTQTLMSYVLAANSLSSAAQGLLVTAWGTFAGNAAPKTMQINVGGLNINSGAVTQSGSTWVLTAEVYKTAANAQTGLLTSQMGTVFTAPKATPDTSVDTGTINISVQCLDASAGQSNVLQNGLIVEYFQ